MNGGVSDAEILSDASNDHVEMVCVSHVEKNVEKK